MARFFLKNGTYFETITDVEPDENGAWPDDRVAVPQRPSADHVWQGDAWVHVPPDPEAVRAEARAAAIVTKGAFCSALHRAGILPVAEAVQAARGDWPATFAAFTASLSEEQAADAQIKWAAATEIHYADPLLQALALHWAGGDPAVAAAVLDQIFGIAP